MLQQWARCASVTLPVTAATLLKTTFINHSLKPPLPVLLGVLSVSIRVPSRVQKESLDLLY